MAAHAAGVAHNDVKAANVLLDDDGAAYLTDFGIAVAGDDARPADEPSVDDVRDLAWLLWELLTGARRPEVPRGRTVPPTGSVPSLIGRRRASPTGSTRCSRKASDRRAGGRVGRRARARRGGPRSDGRKACGHAGRRPSERRAVGLGAASAARTARPSRRPPGSIPYRGLRPFDEADADSSTGATTSSTSSSTPSSSTAVRHRRRRLRLGQELGRPCRPRAAAAVERCASW